jgi:hypothetical protein
MEFDEDVEWENFLVYQRSKVCVLCLFVSPQVNFPLERFLAKFTCEGFEAYGNI